MSPLLAEAVAVRKSADQLFSQAVVTEAIKRLAAEVSSRFGDTNPLVLMVPRGGCYVAAKLMELLDFPLEFDLLQLTRYQNQTSGGELEVRATPATKLQGRHLIIVDDILDQGITLQALIDFCALRNPASVSSLVLVDKQCQRAVDIEADLVGIRAPDRYLFGCGMDYKGYWRNLPAIYAVAE
ncbi:MAG TPA: hypoxanthine-guanine phosphoribosyltransferase [Gammaproteobacteria bacterium]|nr:hypoxanthine-guanine phosphoribosyltransferase [Gammaproteobacteria bacterium]